MRVDKLTRKQRRLRLRMRPAAPFVRKARFQRDLILTWGGSITLAVLVGRAFAESSWVGVHEELITTSGYFLPPLLMLIAGQFFPTPPTLDNGEEIWWYDSPVGSACAVLGLVRDPGHPHDEFWEVKELLQTRGSSAGHELLSRICADADALSGLGFREGQRWIARAPRTRGALARAVSEHGPVNPAGGPVREGG